MWWTDAPPAHHSGANERVLKVVASHFQQLQAAEPEGRVHTSTRFTPSQTHPLYLRQMVNDSSTELSSSTLVLPTTPCWDLSIRSVLAAVGLCEPPSPGSGPEVDTTTGTATASLRQWLEQVVLPRRGALTRALDAHHATVRANHELAETITENFGLNGLGLLKDEWNPSSNRKMLQILSTEIGRNFSQYPYPVRFTSLPSRVGSDGAVELGVSDVPQVWSRTLQRRNDLAPVHSLVECKLDELRQKLYGASISSMTMDPVEFAKFLEWLSPSTRPDSSPPENGLRRHPLLRHVWLHASEPKVATGLTDPITSGITHQHAVQVLADPTALRLALTQNGTVLCPTHATGKQLSQYLVANSAEAMKRQAQTAKNESARNRTLTEMALHLDIKITHFKSLTRDQSERFARKLIASPRPVRDAIRGLHVHISELPPGVFLCHDARGAVEIPWQGPFE